MAKIGGPKRKPTKDKIALGTFRPDRALENEVEYSVETGTLEPPEILSGQGLIEWNRVAPQVQSRGVLNATDHAALVMYCKEVQTYWECQQVIKTEGYYSKQKNKAEQEYLAINPAVRIAQMALKSAMSIATEFGFTPSSRTRISVKPKKNENPKEAKLLMLSQG